MSATYGEIVTAEALAAYLYAVLAHADFTDRYYEDLESQELRVPLTRDNRLFSRAVTLGKRLIWLHSYGERMVPDGHKPGVLPAGKAKCLKHLPGTEEAYPAEFRFNEATATLRVGQGEFGPVAQEIFDFEVSGLKVLHSWLKYRMKAGGSCTSSPLDNIRPERWTSEYTAELLNLLWIMESTLQCYPEQTALLEEIVNVPLFLADELPPVQVEARLAPKKERLGTPPKRYIYRCFLD